MPKFRYVPSGSLVSVDDATAEKLDHSLWEPVEEKKPAARKAPAKSTDEK